MAVKRVLSMGTGKCTVIDNNKSKIPIETLSDDDAVELFIQWLHWRREIIQQELELNRINSRYYGSVPQGAIGF